MTEVVVVVVAVAAALLPEVEVVEEVVEATADEV